MTEEMPEQQKPQKTASLDDILEAVAKKEAVVKPFTGKKNITSERTGKKIAVSFIQGLAFGLGFMFIVGLGLFILFKLDQLHKANVIFSKLVYILKALGK